MTMILGEAEEGLQTIRFRRTWGASQFLAVAVVVAQTKVPARAVRAAPRYGAVAAAEVVPYQARAVQLVPHSLEAQAALGRTVPMSAAVARSPAAEVAAVRTPIPVPAQLVV